MSCYGVLTEIFDFGGEFPRRIIAGNGHAPLCSDVGVIPKRVVIDNRGNGIWGSITDTLASKYAEKTVHYVLYLS